MLPTNRTTSHPGEILQAEFLDPLGISQVALAAHLGVPVQRINEIVRGKRGITPETAWLFAGAFRTSPELWLNLQRDHDLSSFRPKAKVKPIPRPRTKKAHRKAA
jgi:addiction module HigA family antidote